MSRFRVPDVRVLLADDAPVIREGLARLLIDAGFDVVAQVGDATELLEEVARTQPDVAIVDIRMPPTFSDEGLAAAKRIRSEYDDIGVLVLSQHVDVAYAMNLLQKEPDRVGYLLKDRVADVEELSSAIRRIAEGGSVIDEGLVAELVSAPTVEDPLAVLSTRELEVLTLVAEGRRDRGIAQALHVTEKTVEAHVRSIFRKLDIPADPTENRRVHAVLTFLRARTTAVGYGPLQD
jgi:DNA-binding NarL/FixJ family response regulator